MNVNYVIVDDEKGSRDVLAGFLAKYCPEATPVGEAQNADEAFALIAKVKPDLIFLDISMPDQDGFDLLEKFSRVEFEVIFVTAHEEHAVKAIKSNAVDYLLKPIGIAELKDAVSRAMQRIREKKLLTEYISTVKASASSANPDKISVPVKEGFIYVNVTDIVRCEADGGCTWIYFKNKEKIFATRTLKELEESLSHSLFVRVHQDHLINLQYVIRYRHGRGGQVIMADGMAIGVSQRKRGDFLQIMGIKE